MSQTILNENTGTSRHPGPAAAWPDGGQGSDSAGLSHSRHGPRSPRPSAVCLPLRRDDGKTQDKEPDITRAALPRGGLA